jgi:hypothetical protein
LSRVRDDDLSASSVLHLFPLAGRGRERSERVRGEHAMRFWVGLLLGFLMGMAVTAAYYELWDTGAEDVSPQASDAAEN